MRGLVVLLCGLACAIVASAAIAHRAGESYLYIDVTDDALTGEIHIRLSDFLRVIDFDQNDDGVVSDAEFAARATDAYAYLDGRALFIVDGVEHPPVLGDWRIFSEGDDRQLAIDFTVPSLGPPPDVLEAEFTFLFDARDPRHRTLLLQNSSTRLGLIENEGMHSLIFRPGAERQTLDLRPRPAVEIARDFVVHGLRQILLSAPHLAFAALAMLPIAFAAAGGGWAPDARIAAWVGRIFLVAASVAFGTIASVALTEAFDLSFGWKRAIGIFLAAAALIVWANAKPRGLLIHLASVLLGAGLVGLLATVYASEIGLDLGSPVAAMGGMGLGIWLGAAALGLVAGPLMALAQKPAAYWAGSGAITVSAAVAMALPYIGS